MLERAIRSDPESWEPWLVFADWLAERGDARGRLIGLEHRLATAALSVEQRAEVRGEIDQLVAEQQATWALADVPEDWRLEWRHGFVVGLALTIGEAGLERLRSVLADPAARLLMRLRVRFSSEPDPERDFDEPYEPDPIPTELLGSLFELQHANIRELAFEYAPLGAEGVASLVSWPGLSQLRALDLRYNELGDAALAPLFGSGRLGELRTLCLQRNRIGPSGARALANAPGLQRLRVLDLRDNMIGAEGAAVLAASPQLRGLDLLYLFMSDIGSAGARALADSPYLPLHIRRYWAGQWSAEAGQRGASND